MSNIVAPNLTTRGHLIHCAAVAFALATAFVIVSMPKPETAAAASATPDAAKPATANSAACLQTCCLQTCCLQTCCLQTWPYYEHACLHDSRGDRDARTVRVIAINGPAPHHPSRQ